MCAVLAAGFQAYALPLADGNLSGLERIVAASLSWCRLGRGVRAAGLHERISDDTDASVSHELSSQSCQSCKRAKTSIHRADPKVCKLTQEFD